MHIINSKNPMANKKLELTFFFKKKKRKEKKEEDEEVIYTLNISQDLSPLYSLTSSFYWNIEKKIQAIGSRGGNSCSCVEFNLCRGMSIKLCSSILTQPI
jgi:hypothetical protein